MHDRTENRSSNRTGSCPPAIPIVVSGERIGPAALKFFARYGIKNVAVLK